jgi:hypothetical protein
MRNSVQHLRSSPWLAAVLLVASGLQPSGAQESADPLDVRLNGVPLDLRDVALSRALDYISVFTSSDFVLIGAEVETVDGKEPRVSVHISGSATVREALMELTAKMPEYSFEAVAPHMINVFPASTKNDPRDLLNLNAAELHVAHAVLTNFLGHPDRTIPELRTELASRRAPGCAMGVFPVDIGPEMDLSLKAGTVRDELNEASELSASLAEKGKARAYGWAYFHELLPSPTHPEHRWQVLTSWTPAQLRNRGSPK